MNKTKTLAALVILSALAACSSSLNKEDNARLIDAQNKAEQARQEAASANKAAQEALANASNARKDAEKAASKADNVFKESQKK